MEIYELIIAFVTSLFLGPISSGFIYLLIWMIFLEMWTTYRIKPGTAKAWEVRIGIICASLIGWVLGRWLVIDDTGVEDLNGLIPELLK